jgi:ADP-ribosylglycohydrolase
MFLACFQDRKLTGLGASTLKALPDLAAGGSWQPAGGNTDTNCSIAGQIGRTLLGVAKLPTTYQAQLQRLPERPWLQTTVAAFRAEVLI